MIKFDFSIRKKNYLMIKRHLYIHIYIYIFIYLNKNNFERVNSNQSRSIILEKRIYKNTTGKYIPYFL